MKECGRKRITIDKMSVDIRARYTGRHCICNTRPALHQKDAFRTGNGTMLLQEMGNPLDNKITIQHESLWCPRWEDAPKAPLIKDVLKEVQELILKHRFEEADRLAHEKAAENGTPTEIMPCPKHDAAMIRVGQKGMKIKDYLHVQNMASGEVLTVWKTEKGSYRQRMFCSRADHVAVISLKADEGLIDTVICGEFPEILDEDLQDERYPAIPPEMSLRMTSDGFEILGNYAFHLGGFITAVRLLVNDCEMEKAESGYHVWNGTECMLLIKTERVAENKWEKAEKQIWEELMALPKDYNTLLKHHVEIHQEMFDRLSINLGGPGEDYLLTLTEMREKQAQGNCLLPAFVESMVDMGRYFLLCECGKFPPVYGHVNINVNHQISSGNIGNLPEMMESFFSWIERQLPDARENAERVFGTKGYVIACHPDEESGRQYHFATTYPHEYWISSSGWCLHPFLEHYYCTGDEEFRIKRMIPLYRELALFYHDFLTIEDKNGKYIFVPSYSPENFPENEPWMISINAAMDVEVCREVLETLLMYGKDQITDWERKEYQRILDKLPDYIMGEHGEIKEWLTEDLKDRHDHRHISQLYGAYPGDEFQPERNPKLYRHARITNRMRGMENESCHGVMHRAQIAARLKDSILVEELLRFTLETGYVNENGTTAHNPYVKHYFPDGQGAIPTVALESLIYARPGLIEILPAASCESFREGSLTGMCLRTFAVLEHFAWNGAGAELTIRSLRGQTITFLCRKDYQIIEISGAHTRSREGNSVEFDVKEQEKAVIKVKFI